MACGPSDEFTGRWESAENGQASGSVLNGYLEIVVGQYGNDASGVLRVYDDPFLKFPSAQCPCMYLVDGKIRGTTVTFVLNFEHCTAMVADHTHEGEKTSYVLSLDSLSDFSAAGRILDANANELQIFDLDRIEYEDELIDEVERTCVMGSQQGNP
tara:strand:- start:510 stop:977 length:468 start_codon:yes stop_codon:yes gene_type:complete